MSNETKHTPGPWKVAANHHNAGENRITITANLGDHEYEGIRLVAIVTTPRTDVAEADASLIASAPDLLKENQELKARCQVHANMVGQLAEKLERKEALNTELLEVLEEACFMIQGYQVQHGDGPSNKKKLESLKSILNKAKA